MRCQSVCVCMCDKRETTYLGMNIDSPINILVTVFIPWRKVQRTDSNNSLVNTVIQCLRGAASECIYGGSSNND